VWQITVPPDGQEEALIISFSFSGDPPTARAAKRFVANALKHENMTWITTMSRGWNIDLPKMCEYFKISSSWLSGRVVVDPEYEIRPQEFKPGFMRGLLTLTIERDDLAANAEPCWGEYPEDELAELVSLLRRSRFQQDVTWLCTAGAPSFSLLAIDIDKFELINDTFGHPVGDIVLVRTSQIIREIVGRRGLAYRCGGEEISVLLPGFTSPEAMVVGERIRRCIESEVWSYDNNARVTISVGVAETNPDETPECLVKRADGALYEAKRDGRNLVREAGQGRVSAAE
jgi:diguanylate cyclase (GGDEF)-like protein